MFCSDIIGCQREPSLFTFTFWTIGKKNFYYLYILFCFLIKISLGKCDLEICLLDLNYQPFNCTGMLESRVQPAKVSLKIPSVLYPFRVYIY